MTISHIDDEDGIFVTYFCPQLRSLHLIRLQMAIGLQEILKNLGNIEVLELRQIDALSDDAIHEISSSAKSSITHFSVNACPRLTSESKKIVNKMPSLELLEITGCPGWTTESRLGTGRFTTKEERNKGHVAM
jgi:hypothetical protein